MKKAIRSKYSADNKLDLRKSNTTVLSYEPAMDSENIRKERHIGRSEDSIRNVIGSILLHEIRDPRIPELTSITKVVLSQELGSAQVFVAIPTSKEDSPSVLQVLEKSAPYLRKRLSSMLNMKKTPKLTFVKDDELAIENDLDIMLRNIE